MRTSFQYFLPGFIFFLSFFLHQEFQWAQRGPSTKCSLSSKNVQTFCLRKLCILPLCCACSPQKIFNLAVPHFAPKRNIVVVLCARSTKKVFLRCWTPFCFKNFLLYPFFRAHRATKLFNLSPFLLRKYLIAPLFARAVQRKFGSLLWRSYHTILLL